MPSNRGVGSAPFLRSPSKGTFYSLQSDSPDSAGLIRQTGNSLSRAQVGLGSMPNIISSIDPHWSG